MNSDDRVSAPSISSQSTTDEATPLLPELEDLEGLDPTDLEAIAERLAEPSEISDSADDRPEVSAEVLATPSKTAPSDTDTDTTDRKAETAAQLYLVGRSAFESGYYRQAINHLEKAVALSVKASPVGGEMQVWLVTAYQAHGDVKSATSLCRQLTQHPNIDTRQKSRRLLAILEAPQLAMRSEWLSKIPDLSKIEDSEGDAKKGSSTTYKPRPIRKLKEPEIDPSTIVRDDNQFIWIAIAVVLLVLAWTARAV